jgi:hypothetical protein
MVKRTRNTKVMTAEAAAVARTKMSDRVKALWSAKGLKVAVAGGCRIRTAGGGHASLLGIPG